MTSPILKFRCHLRVTALLSLVALLLLVLPDSAHAGRYVVAQCDPASRAFADAAFERRNGGDYGFAHRCEEDEDASSLQIYTITRTPQDHFGRISWGAPAGSRIVGVALEARLRSDAGQQAQVSFTDPYGVEVGRIATGAAVAGGFERYERQLADGGRDRVAVSLACTERSGCPASDQAKAWVRSLRLTIEDHTAPSVTASGSLLAPGWHRGAGELVAEASDGGSGVHRIEAAVGMAGVAPTQTFQCAVIAGSAMTSRTQPCAGAQRVAATLDTTAPPFADGANLVTVCARDYGSDGAPGCAQQTVMVDNTPPALILAPIGRTDPELIRAPVSDGHSGVAGGALAYRPVAGGAWRELPTELVAGELQARVDSSSEHPGRYLLRATAADVAGNIAATTSRTGGEEMIVTFPLRDETRLAASIEGRDRFIAAYDERPELTGKLRDERGRPLTGEPVEVLERFAGGSTLEPVSHVVRTDAHGRYAARVARGPSRRITVRYAGSPRRLPAVAEPVRLGVRGAATLKISSRRVRAGRRAAFSGSIGRYGARVPEAGKLVELQVSGGGIRRPRTVRQAFRTDAGGRWSIRYGFDRFYSRPTRFRFRLKVTPESRWPYLGPVYSARRPLTVLPR